MKNKIFKISIFLLIMFLTVKIVFNAFSIINVQAYDNIYTKQLSYYLISRQNIVYYDIEENTTYEAELDICNFIIDNETIYDNPTEGYIIRSNNTIYRYSSNYEFDQSLNVISENNNILLIIYSNLDVYLWENSDAGEKLYNYFADEQVEIDIEYDFESVDRNFEMLFNIYDEDDVPYKIDNYFYFENLSTNFGINETGSCSYVAIGMLLSYYDIFENNNLIVDEELYLSGKATQESITGNTTKSFINSESSNTYNFYDFNVSPGSTNAFHNYLVYEIGRDRLGYINSDAAENETDGLTLNQTYNVLEYYLQNVADLNRTDYTINIYGTEREIKNEIDRGNPVLLLCKSWCMDLTMSNDVDYINFNVINYYYNMGHTMIAYGYDEIDGTIYFKCHLGYLDDELNSFSNSVVLSFGDNEIAAISLDLHLNHVCSHSYVYSNGNEIQGFCPTCGSLYKEEINLNCKSDDYINTNTINHNHSLLYDLKMDCASEYTFSINSQEQLNINLYDEDMNIISNFITINVDDAYFYSLNRFLDIGKYYIKIELASYNYNSEVDICFKPSQVNAASIYINENANVLEHAHNRENKFLFNPIVTGFYKVELICASNEPINWREGSIIVKKNGQIVNRYFEYDLAINKNGENALIWFAEANDNYCISVSYENEDIESLNLKITSVESQTIDLFNISQNNNSTINIISSNKHDNIKKIDLKEKGRFEVNVTYSGVNDTYVSFILLKVNNNLVTEIACEYLDELDLDNYYDFDEGTYYIGYLNKDDAYTFNISFKRKVSDSDNTKLVVDASDDYNLGSMIKIYDKDKTNKSYNSTNMIKGFTRCVSISYSSNLEYSLSNYSLYSSNPLVASVSEYGTVLAKSVGTFKIMAVLNSDPSVVFIKEFNVIEDDTIEELIVNLEATVHYSESGMLYQIYLNDDNCPYPQNTLYNWNVIDSINYNNYSISIWGTIFLSGSDVIIIKGLYSLNESVSLILELTVII